MSDEPINIEKQKRKAKLLKALADRGEGGEKVNAKIKLDEHLLKYNLTLDDITASNKRKFTVRSEDDNMIVMNSILSVNPFVRTSTSLNLIEVELDDEDFLEVKNKIKHFIKLYKIGKEIYTMAFMSKHSKYFQPDEHTQNK